MSSEARNTTALAISSPVPKPAEWNTVGNHLQALVVCIRGCQQVTQSWRVDRAWTDRVHASIGEHDIVPALLAPDVRLEAIEIAKVQQCPRTPVTFRSISFIAAANSKSRRAVMSTVFPSSLPMYFSWRICRAVDDAIR